MNTSKELDMKRTTVDFSEFGRMQLEALVSHKDELRSQIVSSYGKLTNNKIALVSTSGFSVDFPKEVKFNSNRTNLILAYSAMKDIGCVWFIDVMGLIFTATGTFVVRYAGTNFEDTEKNTVIIFNILKEFMYEQTLQENQRSADKDSI